MMLEFFRQTGRTYAATRKYTGAAEVYVVGPTFLSAKHIADSIPATSKNVLTQIPRGVSEVYVDHYFYESQNHAVMELVLPDLQNPAVREGIVKRLGEGKISYEDVFFGGTPAITHDSILRAMKHTRSQSQLADILEGLINGPYTVEDVVVLSHVKDVVPDFTNEYCKSAFIRNLSNPRFQ